MQYLTHYERLFLQALAENEGVANRDITTQSVARFEGNVPDSINLQNEMIVGLVAHGLIQKACGEPARITEAGRKALAEHPLDEPVGFGEEDDFFAVRGDIPAEDAARRIAAFIQERYGELREPVEAQKLLRGFVAHLPDCGDGEEGWQLTVPPKLPDPHRPSAQVWAFDNR